jgi:predicted metal-dependent phosphoesterase TrpH
MSYQSLQVVLISLLFLLSNTVTGQSKIATKRWYKGNLHTHTYWSDGDEYPEMILDWYKTRGYDFVALSDHNTLARGEKWVKVIKSGSYQEAFDKYLARFGNDWVIHKMDSGRTLVKLKTYPEYKQKMEDKNFLIIPAEEITDRFEGKPIHLGAINLQSILPPQGGTSVTETIQRNVDAVLQQRKETGIPIFPHINHPNFYYAITPQDMIDVHGERFFEVYNGHQMVNNEGDSAHLGTEAMWDMINIAYYKRNQPLLLGMGSDDSHNYHQFGKAYSNAGRGWVMVLADSLTPYSLIDAMERGDFYASTGVTLSELKVVKNEIIVGVKGEKGVKYTIEFIGVKKGWEKAEVLKRVEGVTGKFKLTSQHAFVRAKIISNKVKVNPVKEKEPEIAWTQPVQYK